MQMGLLLHGGVLWRMRHMSGISDAKHIGIKRYEFTLVVSVDIRS